MRICILTPDRPEQGLNGPRRIADESARALAALGHDVNLIGHAEGKPQVESVDGFWHHRVEIVDRGLPGLEGSAAAMELYAAAAKHRAVLELHASTPVDLVVAAIWPGEGLICLLDDQLATATVLVTPVKLMVDRGMLSGEPYETMARIERAIVRRSVHTHGTSSAIAADVESTFGVKLPRSELAPLFMVDRAGRPGHERYARPSETEVLFVGRAEPRKGADVLLAAARQCPHAAYVLVGPGYWGPLRSGAETDERLQERVSFLGEVDDARLWRLYAGADIVVVPSRYESFGYPLIEAMMFGKAIVATDVGGMPAVVEDEGNALLCPPDDPQALADSLSQLVEDAERRAAYGRRSRELYEQRFSVAVGASRTAALYERMAADHRLAAKAAAKPLIELLTEAVAEIERLEDGVARELAHGLLTETGRPTTEPPPDWARRAKGAEDRAQRAEARVHEIERRNEQLQDQLDAVVNSNSWRLTKPLRALRRRERLGDSGGS